MKARKKYLSDFSIMLSERARTHSLYNNNYTSLSIVPFTRAHVTRDDIMQFGEFEQRFFFFSLINVIAHSSSLLITMLRSKLRYFKKYHGK